MTNDHSNNKHREAIPPLNPQSSILNPLSPPPPTFSVSAPGSFMLLGEHAVLRGHTAVVCAIDRRLMVTLTPRKDDDINIHSETIGSLHTSRSELSGDQPFHFILSAISSYQSWLSHGFDLQIVSGFSDKMGLGSSAAVTVATLGTLQQWLFQRLNQDDICTRGIAVIRQVQGVGSGADIAASTYGGMLSYRTSMKQDSEKPFLIEALPIDTTFPRLTLIYVGYKTKTTDVIRQVEQNALKNPVKFNKLFLEIDKCATKGIEAIRKREWLALGKIMNQQYCLQKSLGVSDDTIDQLIESLSQQKNTIGTKISGSGLGDCVVVLGHGHPEAIPEPMILMDGMITNEGVRYESI